MAGIMNNTARQFNLKCQTKKGYRVTIRVAPGFNVVDDAHWNAFLKPKLDPYVAELQKKKFLEFGEKVDDMELDQDPDTQSKSKATPPPEKKED